MQCILLHLKLLLYFQNLSPRLTENVKSRRGRSWTPKRGPSGTYTGLPRVASTQQSLISRRSANFKTHHPKTPTI